MTYLELENLIKSMTPEQKACEALVYVSNMDSHFPIDEVYFLYEEEYDLKEGQPICAIDW